MKILNNAWFKTHANICKEWDFKRNYPLRPQDLRCDSQKMVWWRCCNEHKYKNSVKNRLRNLKCPLCRPYRGSLGDTFPDLLKEWDYGRNKIDPYSVGSCSYMKVWWICRDNPNHKWKTSIRNKTRDRPRCPSCKVPFNKSLYKKNPALTRFWHPTKNKKLTPKDVSSGSHKKIWLKCKKCGNEWQESPHTIDRRLLGYSHSSTCGICTFCNGHRASRHNNLAITHPKLLKEWDFTRNKISPYKVTHGSQKKVHLRCKNGHRYIAIIWDITHGKICPRCNGLIVLRDGEVCASFIEAYYYLLFKGRKINFTHNKPYGKNFGKRRYDFYFPRQNIYLEVTGFTKNSHGYRAYMKGQQPLTENLQNPTNT